MSIDGRNGGDIQAPSAAGCAVVGFALAGLFLSLYTQFLFAFESTDYDALAVVAEIRATGRVVGWPGGFFFQGALAAIAHVGLLPFGAASGDWLLAHRLAMTACAIGSSLLVFAASIALTRRTGVSALAAILHAFAPGTVALVAQAEDNLSASFMGTLHACAFLLLISSRRWPPARARAIAPIAYAFTLTLAVSCHRQLGVLWIAPALLWPFLSGESRAARARLVAAIYAMAATLFLALFAALTLAWMGGFNTGDWVHFLRTWLFPGSYYRGFYFFNAFGWDLPRQGGEIASGLRQLVAAREGPRIELAYFALIVGALVPLRDRRRVSGPVAALALLAAIHIPHSLVYESGNLERWDAILAPAAILGALAVSASLRAARGRWPAIAMLCCASAITAYDASHLVTQIRGAWEGYSAPASAKRDALFRVGLEPSAHGKAAPLLVLARAEYAESFGVAATRFSYRDSIIVIDGGARAFRPERPYPQPPREIPWEEFGELARTRRLVLTPLARSILREQVPEPAAAD